MRNEIVKVQRPLNMGDQSGDLMLYNNDQSFIAFLPVESEEGKTLVGAMKISAEYFDNRFRNKMFFKLGMKEEDDGTYTIKTATPLYIHHFDEAEKEDDN